MPDLERISLTIDKELLERFDGVMQSTGQENRSEAIRDLIRARLVEEEWRVGDTEVVATLTILYDHHKREFAHQLLHVGHEHHDRIISTMHIHIDEDHCLEVMALKGPARELHLLAHRMLNMKGVKHGRLVLTSSAV